MPSHELFDGLELLRQVLDSFPQLALRLACDLDLLLDLYEPPLGLLLLLLVLVLRCEGLLTLCRQPGHLCLHLAELVLDSGLTEVQRAEASVAAAGDLTRLELRAVEGDDVLAAYFPLEADGLTEIGADDLVPSVEVDGLPETGEFLTRGGVNYVAERLAAELLHSVR